MGNAISFRLNPKCESDRKILAWLEEKSDQPGYQNQTELIKQALLVAMEQESRGRQEKEVVEWLDEAIKRATETFSNVVQESSQNMANNMFAGVLGAMMQQMNSGMLPMQVPVTVQNGISGIAHGAVPITGVTATQEQTVSDNELASDNSAAMDNATKNMLGSLFDMDD
ncbi:MAG: hypothetical protein IJZ00_01520 [Lachnospiraceae bacterium]|nr:hypothetical protein [Lachnospiraceae bacterium]